MDLLLYGPSCDETILLAECHFDNVLLKIHQRMHFGGNPKKYLKFLKRVLSKTQILHKGIDIQQFPAIGSIQPSAI